MKKEIIISLIFTLLLITGCGVFKNTQSTQLLFEFERTSCYGTCPVYEIDIYTNGRVVLEGKKHIDKTGRFESKLKRDQLDKLINDFESISFFELENSYRSQFKDLPTKYITYHKDGKSKQVMAYDNIPKKLQQLIDQMEKLTSELEWEKIE